jgi:hypothetical protein
MPLIAIDDIVIECRHRRDLGDLNKLAASMKAVGQLQDVVVTEDMRLIVGQRRIEALRINGTEKVRVFVAKDLVDVALRLQAEQEENTCRKDFAPSEAAAVAKARLPAMQALAKAAQKEHGGTAPGKKKSLVRTSDKCSRDHSRDAAAMAAATAGLSADTIKKIDAVVASGDAELIAEMDTTGKVDRAFKKLPGSRKSDAAKAEKAAKKKARLVEIKAMRKSRLLLPLSERAMLCREAIICGMKTTDALDHFRIEGRQRYGRVCLVVEKGRAILIEAIDGGVLAIGQAYRLIDASETDIAKEIEEAKLKAAAKNHKPLSITGQSCMQLYHDLLERTWVNWSGFRDNFPVNSKAVPKIKEKREAMLRLCKNVRAVVTTLIDQLEKEMT